MIALALGLLLTTVPAAQNLSDADDLERRSALHILREFERVGRRAPTQDKALTEAARQLARGALTHSPIGAPDLLTLTSAVSDAGAADPSPYSLVIRASVPSHAVETFLDRKDFNNEPATHFGVGVRSQGGRTALVVLLANRKATLQPFPRTFPKPESRVLCGELTPPLEDARVFVTRPDGKVEPVSLTRESGQSFCTRLAFTHSGTYTVEVVASGRGGPEVAALFLVDVGTQARTREREPVAEPSTLSEARAQILERINALRRAHGQAMMTRDETLEQVAQAYSERMAREGFFAHVAPDGSTLRTRLARTRASAYPSVGENLGMADGPLAAHFGIEHSPGHRKNLLDARFRLAGIGIAWKEQDGRRLAIVTEVYAAGSPSTPSFSARPLDEAYATLARHRSEKKLPPMERSEVLEQIAMQVVRRAKALDQPSAKLPDYRAHERVFAALPDARTATVDFYVVSDPNALPASAGLGTATNNWLGIGLVKGDSPKYGRDQYWVAVIYAAVR